MSFEAMAWAVKQELPVKQKITLLMIANRVNSDTGRCFPSIKKLAADCGMSETSVKEAIRRLKDAGLVIAHERRMEGVSLSNEYELPIVENTTPPACDAPPPGAIRPTPRRVAPPNLEDNLEDEPEHAAHGLFSAKDIPEKKDAEKKEDSAFEDFWEAYPKCPRKTDKPKAKMAFQRIVLGKHGEIAKTSGPVIVAGVRHYAATGPDPQYVPLPTTWLNGARWEQFPPEPPKPQIGSPEDIAQRQARLGPRFGEVVT